MFLILIHEAGHFFVARLVNMRPRKFYIFFPPAIWKTTRGGIEYGVGAIPLGGYVKIPGMHRPAAEDLELHLRRAVDEAPWLSRRSPRAATALEGDDLVAARERAWPGCTPPSSAPSSRSGRSAAPTRASPTSTTGSPTTRTGARRSRSASR